MSKSLKRFFQLLFIFFLFVSARTQAESYPITLEGYGWFGNSENGNSMGFVKLSDTIGEGGGYTVKIQADGWLQGYAWIGLTDGVAPAVGWVYFGALEASGSDAENTPPDGSADAARYDAGTKKISGWARILSLKDVEGCTSCGWIKFAGDGNGNGVEDYATYVDQDEGGNYFLRGLAWAGDGEVEDTGFGFISWGPEGSAPGSGGIPYVAVEGDVYSGGNINIAAESSGQAAFLVLSDGTISNFTSAAGLVRDNTNSELILPSLDLENYPITVISDLDDKIDFGNLDDMVYKVEDDLAVSADLTFSAQSRSATFWVNGDMNILKNINYAGSEGVLENLDALTSVAWVVEGDLTIDPTVRSVVGTFFVKGSIRTGDGINPLESSGPMLGSSFDFGRTHTTLGETVEPAEKIFDDGRLSANPPPGMEDLADLLPSISPVAPE